MAMAVSGKKESRQPFAVSVLQTGFHVKNHGRGKNPGATLNSIPGCGRGGQWRARRPFGPLNELP